MELTEKMKGMVDFEEDQDIFEIADPIAQVAAVCYVALDDVNDAFSTDTHKETLFTSPEVLAAALQLVYPELKQKEKTAQEWREKMREKGKCL